MHTLRIRGARTHNLRNVDLTLPRDKIIVLVGGAPLNEEFGKAVGADAYCRDAGVAVETAKTLIAARRAAARA